MPSIGFHQTPDLGGRSALQDRAAMRPPLPGWPLRWSAPAIGRTSLCQREELLGPAKQLSIRRLAPVAVPAVVSSVTTPQQVKLWLQKSVIEMVPPVFCAKAKS